MNFGKDTNIQSVAYDIVPFFGFLIQSASVTFSIGNSNWDLYG